jgi:hypothetical protein
VHTTIDLETDQLWLSTTGTSHHMSKYDLLPPPTIQSYSEAEVEDEGLGL